MSVLRRIRGDSQSGAATEAAQGARDCIHASMTGQWAEGADTGDDSQASEFVCDSCGTQFDPRQATRVRKRAAEILRRR